MRVRSLLPLIALAALTVAWSLGGCQQQAEQAASVGEQEGAAAAEEDAAADEAESAAEAEEPGEAADEQMPAAAEGEAPLEGLSIDPDKAYGVPDLERLRSVLVTRSEEHRERARKLLVELLLYSNVTETRVTAAGVLGNVVDESVEALTQAALSDPEMQVREAALNALSQASPSPALMDALARLQQADDASVRAAAYKAEIDIRLADSEKLTDWEALSRLLGRRKDDVTAQVQIALTIRGEKSLPTLIEVLEKSPEPVARAAAACCISMICAGTSPQQQDFAREAQIIVKETTPESHPANLDGLKPLERALETDPSPEVRAMAAQGLGYLGQESSAPLLGEALRDESEEVRWWAALALETVPGQQALEDLADAATKDSSQRVREAAVRALGWIEDEAVVGPLVGATGDESSPVRQAAASELGRFTSDLALQALIRLFDDRNEDVRWTAVLAAGKQRNPDAAPALAEALHDPSPMVANAAERALQRMGIGQRQFGVQGES